MSEENRQDIRYSEMGRVVSPELCSLPGVLNDISLTGCKINFPCLIKINMDDEYKINVTSTHSQNSFPLQLLCKPVWVKETNNCTEVGFQYLFSPDDARLHELIAVLEEINEDDFPEIK